MEIWIDEQREALYSAKLRQTFKICFGKPLFLSSLPSTAEL